MRARALLPAAVLLVLAVSAGCIPERGEPPRFPDRAVAEQEDNDSVATAQAVPRVRSTQDVRIAGTVVAGDADFFEVTFDQNEAAHFDCFASQFVIMDVLIDGQSIQEVPCGGGFNNMGDGPTYLVRVFTTSNAPLSYEIVASGPADSH